MRLVFSIFLLLQKKMFGISIFTYLISVLALPCYFYSNMKFYAMNSSLVPSWISLELLSFLPVAFLVLRVPRYIRYSWFILFIYMGIFYFEQKISSKNLMLWFHLITTMSLGLGVLIRFREANPTFLNGKDFYASNSWRKARYAFLRTQRRFDGSYICACCNAKTNSPHVDHIKPRSKYPELALNLNNFQVLCKDCNLGKSNLFEDDFRN